MVETIQAVLTIVIGAAVKYVFKWLKVELDDKTFNAIVGALVVALLALAGVHVAQANGLL